MKAWRFRAQIARALGFDIPRLNARLDSAARTVARQKARIAALELENARLRAQPAPAAGTEAPAVPAASRLRDLLTGLFQQYEALRGISRDAYCDTPQWHAMAEAQYLEAVTIARAAGLLSEAQAEQRARAAVARLQAGALHCEPGVYAQWGLGFRWQDFPADQSFLVTTALVTRSLIVARDLAGCAGLAREGLAGLARMPRAEVRQADGSFSVPIAYPFVDEIVENAIALWAQVVLAGATLSDPSPDLLRDAERALDWLDGRFVLGLGWAYSATRPVYDLMHQVYILEGLRGHPGATDIEERAIEVFASFRAGVSYIDSLTLTDRAKALDGAERSGGQYPVFRGEHVLIARTDPARLWSLGGMLGSFGLFAMEGTRRGYWLGQIRRFPVQVLPDHFGADFRQEMHLARGAALALQALRGA